MSASPYLVSCHCGHVRIEVTAELKGLTECNCSTCGRHGFLHWKVPASAVRLVTESRMLSTYCWREANGGHVFCPICGTGIMRTGYPGDRVSVNARCINGIDVFTLEVARFDGRNEMPPGPRAEPRA